jgi:hypothetical protein
MLAKVKIGAAFALDSPLIVPPAIPPSTTGVNVHTVFGPPSLTAG